LEFELDNRRINEKSHCAVGRLAIQASSKIFKSFPKTFNIQTLKNIKQQLPVGQKFRNKEWRKINSKGTSFLLGRSSNSQQNLNYKFRN
jgi:hypothetical protein